MPTSNQDNAFSEMMSSEIDVVKISKTALDSAIDWIVNEFAPGDIYSDKDLQDWAETNGYTKGE